jgi:hydrogenase maturation factor HypF (carbamoyltransferase family)
MKECEMCGNKFSRVVPLWYQYDNGEIGRMSVCYRCTQAHQDSLKGQSK